MAQDVTVAGASYEDVPSVVLPKTGGGSATFVDSSDADATAADIAQNKTAYVNGVKIVGTASGGGTPAISVVDTPDVHGGTVRTITALDISDTTAVASVVQQGYYFYTAQGIKTAGTGSGGGGGGLTQHEIYLEFSDSTDETIEVDYDDSWVGSLITSTTPSTYGAKTVTLAQLDGVTWYEVIHIPLNTELIDFTAVKNNYIINEDGEEESYPGTCVSDYTLIDPSMTFVGKGYQWFYLGFYDSAKNVISTLYLDQIKDSASAEVATFTLNSQRIPQNAMYVRIDSLFNPSSSQLSLIRTA